ncbi:membrane protein, putative [Pseudooceanicola batsensis HTCC2597]|uniref:Membrane protein, putative n=1 Tax=Pseudooceanicola batsensis (strain ATCC BAA-863 / DSM 15984 / KCTC 12145 / HTCC2597) TaxID=252305 RepID=A3TYF1_PSEBH|nr:MFS transporter [Pseudooceanicola batsensis]EAQ03185.1 membrane protein, putative [Pseudooceanicola batsensis HTCC2597]
MTRDSSPFGLLALLLLAGMTAAAQFAKVSVIFPQVRALYPEAGAGVGFLVSVISLTGVLAGLVAGMLVARAGFRRVVIQGLLLGAAMSAVQALVLPLPLMLLSRAVEGVSHIALVVAIPTLIAQLSAARHRPYTMTLWGSYFGVTFALVAWLGIPLAEARGPAPLFLVHAGCMTVLAAALAWRLPAGLVPRSTRPLPTPRKILGDHPRIYASPYIAAPALGWLFYTLTFVALLTVLPPMLPDATRATLTFWMPLAGIIVSLTLGAQLLRILPAVTIILIGLAGAMLSVLAMWRAPGVLLPPICLFGALGLVQGASFTAIPQLNPDPADQALANGALAQMGNLGNLLGTPVLIAMTSPLGFDGAILFALLAYAGCALVHLHAAARRRA